MNHRFGYYRPVTYQESLWMDNPLVNYESEQDALEYSDPSDCGGWGWGPPCGGCGRCVRAQISYGYEQSRIFAKGCAKYGLRWNYAVIDGWRYRGYPHHDGMAHLIHKCRESVT